MTALATTAAAGIGLSTAAGANAATGLAGTAPANSAPGWSPASPAAVGGAVTATTSVQFSGKKAQWAFVTTSFLTDGRGYPSVYSRIDNGSWAKTTLPGSGPGEVFVAATAISNTSVLAFANLPNGTGREWQFNGSTWKVIKTFSAPIGNASVTSASNVWVAGTLGGTQLGVYHYNGATWTKVASTLHGVRALSSTTAEAYTGTSFARYDGKAWTATSLAGLIGGSGSRITDVFTTFGTTYAVGVTGSGTTVILAGNGTSWAKVGQVAGEQPLPNEISADGGGGIWFLAAANGSEGSAAIHYTRSVKTTAVSELPGKVMSITLVGGTNELAGGSMASGKADPATYAELEYYN